VETEAGRLGISRGKGISTTATERRTNMKNLLTQPLLCALLVITPSCVLAQDEQSLAQDEQSFVTDSPDPDSNESATSEGTEGETNPREEHDADFHLDYDSVVNHYSNHWPSLYNIYLQFPSSGATVHFYARWKWYQGYGSRTVCMVANDCGMPLGCAQEFYLPYGACTYTFDVDGPYQMKSKISWFSSDTFSDWWDY
jgi:hypothetical protein